MRAALATACLLPVLMTAGLAHAGQDEENKLRQQLRTVVLQLRELQDAQGALQAKAAAATAQRDTAKKDAAAAKARVVVKTDDAKVDALTRQVTDLQAASAEAAQRAQPPPALAVNRPMPDGR